MIDTLQRIWQGIDCLNEWVGRAVSWLTLGMVLMTFAIVMRRYLFASGYPWEQELVRFMHAFVFLLGAGYTLKAGGHVRVDVCYSRFTVKLKLWVNLLGTVLLLWPFCAAIGWYATDFILNSWAIREASTEYNGMPGIYLLKTSIWAFCAVLALQGLSIVIDATCRLRTGDFSGLEEKGGEEAPHG